MKPTRSSSRTPAGFAARVYLPVDHEPLFPEQCISCGEKQTLQWWSLDRSDLLRSDTIRGGQKFPAIHAPVCERCIDQMPGHPRKVSVIVGHLVPTVFLIVTLLFFFIGMKGVAVLVGAAGLVWFALATHLAWATPAPSPFEVQFRHPDRMVYYFRDNKYAALFDELNKKRDEARGTVHG